MNILSIEENIKNRYHATLVRESGSSCVYAAIVQSTYFASSSCIFT